MLHSACMFPLLGLIKAHDSCSVLVLIRLQELFLLVVRTNYNPMSVSDVWVSFQKSPAAFLTHTQSLIPSPLFCLSYNANIQTCTYPLSRGGLNLCPPVSDYCNWASEEMCDSWMWGNNIDPGEKWVEKYSKQAPSWKNSYLQFESGFVYGRVVKCEAC